MLCKQRLITCLFIMALSISVSHAGALSSIFKEGVEEAGEYALKKGVRESVEEAGEYAIKRGVREGAEEAGEYGLKKGAREGAEEIGEYGVRRSAVSGAREGLEQSGRAQASKVLARNLMEAGMEGFEGAAAHHIVPFGAARAAKSRMILNRFGIDLNAAENGVWLPVSPSSSSAASLHQFVHTKDYYAEVERLMGMARSRDEAIDTLRDIAKRLSNDEFPY